MADDTEREYQAGRSTAGATAPSGAQERQGNETPVRHGRDRREFDRGPQARGVPPGSPMPERLLEMLSAQAFTPADDGRGSDDRSGHGQAHPRASDAAPRAADADRPTSGHARERSSADAGASPTRPAGPRPTPRGAEPRPQRPPVDRRRMLIGGGIVVGLLIVLLLVGILPHRARQRQLAARARQAVLADSIPLVAVERVSRSAPGADLMLPGTLQSNHETPIYARSTGYVRRWYADIGARVHRGDVLATVDAPDLDQELAQAQQQVANARAALQLSAVTLARWKILYRDSTVTKQELDTYQSNYTASVANVAAAEANVQRLAALVGFERITAPIDGVVTARNIDNGVFVTASGTTNAPQPAGTGGNTIIGVNATTELFRIASTDTIRVYLGVPQSYAPSVHVGIPAVLAIRELPGRTFAGRITRTADAVDAASLTLLTEVDVLNPDRSLLPGMYAEAHFRFERTNAPILMPGTAMIFRTSAPQAAVVGSDSLVHFHNLEIGRDFGTVIEVDSGLADGDFVVAQPSDDLRDGQPVHARVDTQQGAPGGDTRAGVPVTSPASSSSSQNQKGKQKQDAKESGSSQTGQSGGSVGQGGTGGGAAAGGMAERSESRSGAAPSRAARAQAPGQEGGPAGGASGVSQSGAAPYKPPPQLEEGFPAAAPPPAH